MYEKGNPDIDMGIDWLGKEFNTTIGFYLTYTGNRWVGFYNIREETDWSAVMKEFERAHGKIHLFTHFALCYWSHEPLQYLL